MSSSGETGEDESSSLLSRSSSRPPEDSRRNQPTVANPTGSGSLEASPSSSYLSAAGGSGSARPSSRANPVSLSRGGSQSNLHGSPSKAEETPSQSQSAIPKPGGRSAVQTPRSHGGEARSPHARSPDPTALRRDTRGQSAAEERLTGASGHRTRRMGTSDRGRTDPSAGAASLSQSSAHPGDHARRPQRQGGQQQADTVEQSRRHQQGQSSRPRGHEAAAAAGPASSRIPSPPRRAPYVPRLNLAAVKKEDSQSSTSSEPRR